MLPVLVVVSLLHLGQSCAQLNKCYIFFYIFFLHLNLQWLSWNGSLLTVAVGIYNSYTERTDYICKHNCEAGFYTRGLTANTPTVTESTTFEILTNRDHFEYVEMRVPGTMLGITTGITAKIPLTGSRGVEFSGEKTLQFNRGTTMVAAHSHSVSVELKVPPNHSCTMYMEGRKLTTDIPFTARLSRTYGNGETQWTSISGVYDAVQIGEIRAVVDRCEPVVDAKPRP
uniref:Uncharacterized protein n=1 Tax=Salmo trutta TaxID=8032 RepID=A0A673WFS1_SALTR